MKLGGAIIVACLAAPASAAPIAIDVDGWRITCGKPDRCEGIWADGAVELRKLDQAAVVTYGARGATSPEADVVALALAAKPADLLKGFREVGTIKLAIAWPDGTRGEAELKVTNAAVARTLNRLFARVTGGPVALPGDDAHPHGKPPRGLIVLAAGGVLRGDPAKLTELDWVVVTREVETPCPRPSTEKGTGYEATIYARRTGKLVDRRTFPGDCDDRSLLRNVHKEISPIADWAWQRGKGN